MNKLNKLITLLEKISNKKVKLVLKESEIFKHVRIDERLRDLKEKFDSKCEFDHEEKTLTYTGNIWMIEYNILLNYYKNYIVNVDGTVWLINESLNSIDIKFEKVIGSFNCNDNNLTSLKNCPEEIRGGWFDCSFNKLETLEHCPKKVGEDFFCSNNSKQFTKKEVKEKCKVSGNIHV